MGNAGSSFQGNFMMNRTPTQGLPGNVTHGAQMTMNSGAGPGGNINYELLQSMMQRNVNGGMNR